MAVYCMFIKMEGLWKNGIRSTPFFHSPFLNGLSVLSRRKEIISAMIFGLVRQIRVSVLSFSALISQNARICFAKLIISIGSLAQIRRWLGHTTKETTLKYLYNPYRDSETKNRVKKTSIFYTNNSCLQLSSKNKEFLDNKKCQKPHK